MTIQTQVLAAILIGLAGTTLGWKLGADSVKADQLAEIKSAFAQQGKDAESSADAGTAARNEGDAKQLATQDQTENGNETIRTVYRTVFVAADCVQPPGVMQQLEATRESANGAVRAAGGGAGPRTPERGRLSR